MRNASSSSGCSRSSEWQWLSTIGIASTARSRSGAGSGVGAMEAGPSVLEEVLFELEGLVLIGIRVRLGAPDEQVFAAETLAERGHEDRVLLEFVHGLGRALGEPPDPASLSLAVAEVARVPIDRFAGVEATLDAV